MEPTDRRGFFGRVMGVAALSVGIPKLAVTAPLPDVRTEEGLVEVNAVVRTYEGFGPSVMAAAREEAKRLAREETVNDLQQQMGSERQLDVSFETGKVFNPHNFADCTQLVYDAYRDAIELATGRPFGGLYALPRLEKIGEACTVADADHFHAVVTARQVGVLVETTAHDEFHIVQRPAITVDHVFSLTEGMLAPTVKVGRITAALLGSIGRAIAERVLATPHVFGSGVGFLPKGCEHHMVFGPLALRGVKSWLAHSDTFLQRFDVLLVTGDAQSVPHWPGKTLPEVRPGW